VDVSDAVRKGDLLLQLDPENEQRSLKRAEVSLAVSQAKLAQARLSFQVAERELATERTRAEASLKSAEVKAREAESKLKRVKELHGKNMASREELESAQTTAAQATADLEGARARIEDLKSLEIQIDSKKQGIAIAEAQVETDKISLDDAKQRLAETTVTAPIDGVVANRDVQVGQIIASGVSNVGGGTAVMTLADLSRTYVLVSVDESDIGRIETRQRARITVDAHPDAFFPGEVVRVATKGLTSSNVVTFEVKVEVKGQSRRLLKPEMSANVEITAVEKDDVLLVPVNAVQRRRREQTIMVRKEDGSSEERTVQTGASDGEMMEIVEGLSEKETVLVPKGGAQSRWRGGSSRTERAVRRRMPGRPPI
jgi:multidrug resistance efflux pump